jgi:hypothetical protein
MNQSPPEPSDEDPEEPVEELLADQLELIRGVEPIPTTYYQFTAAMRLGEMYCTRTRLAWEVAWGGAVHEEERLVRCRGVIEAYEMEVKALSPDLIRWSYGYASLAGLPTDARHPTPGQRRLYRLTFDRLAGANPNPAGGASR